MNRAQHRQDFAEQTYRWDAEERRERRTWSQEKRDRTPAEKRGRTARLFRIEAARDRLKKLLQPNPDTPPTKSEILRKRRDRRRAHRRARANG